MSIKLIQVTAAYKPAYIYGGPTMSVAKLCEALVREDINLEVLTTTANGKTELPVTANEPEMVEGVKVTYCERITKDHTHFSPFLLGQLAKRIKEAKGKQPLIVHIHAWWNLVSIFSCLLAKYFKIPVLLSPRGMLTSYSTNNRHGGFKSIIHFALGKRLLKYCHIHVTSEKEKQDVLGIIQPKSITVIPNLVAFPSFDGNLKNVSAENDNFQLIFLSRVEEKKGLELLFEALSTMKVNWQLTIAGTGETTYIDELKYLSNKLNIANQINWIGLVKNEDKFKLIHTHDLFVLTSYNENFANVVIESLSVGTPVLLSNQVGLADYVLEKNLGWVSDLSISQIKAQLELAFENTEMRKAIRETAPAIIAKDFDSKQLIQQYLSTYQKISNP